MEGLSAHPCSSPWISHRWDRLWRKKRDSQNSRVAPWHLKKKYHSRGVDYHVSVTVVVVHLLHLHLDYSVETTYSSNRKVVTVQNCNFKPVGSASENTWTPAHCTNKQHQRLKGRFQKGFVWFHQKLRFKFNPSVSWIALIQPRTLARHHWQPLGTWTTVMFSSAFAWWEGMRVRLARNVSFKIWNQTSCFQFG